MWKPGIFANASFAVRNWEFLRSDIGHPAGAESLQLSRRRASTVVADLPPNGQAVVGAGQEAKRPKGLGQPAHQEPDADSFLDSFGF